MSGLAERTEFRGSFPRHTHELAEWHAAADSAEVLEPELPIVDAHHHLFGTLGRRPPLPTRGSAEGHCRRSPGGWHRLRRGLRIRMAEERSGGSAPGGGGRANRRASTRNAGSDAQRRVPGRRGHRLLRRSHAGRWRCGGSRGTDQGLGPAIARRASSRGEPTRERSAPSSRTSPDRTLWRSGRSGAVSRTSNVTA